MDWFIIQSERKSWTKYLVEAKDEDAALANCDDWEYLGYVDGEDTKSELVSSALETKAEALQHDMAFVEG